MSVPSLAQKWLRSNRRECRMALRWISNSKWIYIEKGMKNNVRGCFPQEWKICFVLQNIHTRWKETAQQTLKINKIFQSSPPSALSSRCICMSLLMVLGGGVSCKGTCNIYSNNPINVRTIALQQFHRVNSWVVVVFLLLHIRPSFTTNSIDWWISYVFESSVFPHVIFFHIFKFFILVRELGKFHGECYALKESNRGLFHIITKSFKEARFNHKVDMIWDATMRVSPKRGTQAIREHPELRRIIPESFLKKIDDKAENVWDFLRGFVQPREPLGRDFLFKNVQHTLIW